MFNFNRLVAFRRTADRAIRRSPLKRSFLQTSVLLAACCFGNVMNVAQAMTEHDIVYQLRADGSIWQEFCTGSSCAGWVQLDNNPAAVSITTGLDGLVQRHSDGSIWTYTFTPCNANGCPGWLELDHNAATISVASSFQYFQLHSDGSIWQCDPLDLGCTGWTKVDHNPASKEIVVAGGIFAASPLVQLHSDGSIWRFTGAACGASSCPGWQKLDNNPRAVAVAGFPSSSSNDAGAIFQLHNDGSIWRYTGIPCNGNVCPGWQDLDNNPKAIAITVAALTGTVYQLHNDGSIWRFTGTPCNAEGCPGWQQLDNNPATTSITAAAHGLFQLHNDGSIWRFTGVGCNNAGCPGWQQLDNNPEAKAIVSSFTQTPQ